MNEKEVKLQMLSLGSNYLSKAIMALNIDYFVDDLKDFRDEVNREIDKLKEVLGNEYRHD